MKPVSEKKNGETTFKSLSPLITANLYFGNILLFFYSNVIRTCQGNFRKKISVKYFTFIECHFFGLNNPVFLYLVNFQYLCIVCQKCKNMVCVFFSANFRNGCRKRPARHIELRLKKIVQKSRMEKNIYEKSTLGFSR